MAPLVDAENLILRAYDLGKSTLVEVVTVRRETGQARAAHLDALVALARARIALDATAGLLL
jgi:outer membrane protein TolC